MKTIIKVTFALLLIGAMLASPLSAAANDNKILFTGIMTGLGELPDDGSYMWFTGRTFPWVIHFRNDTGMWQITASSDPRLGEWMLQKDLNGEWFYNEYGLVKIHVWGSAVFTADAEFQDVLWDCSYNGFFDAESAVVNEVCQGVGENKGLILKMTSTPLAGAGDQYEFAGTIIETGGY